MPKDDIANCTEQKPSCRLALGKLYNWEGEIFEKEDPQAYYKF